MKHELERGRDRDRQTDRHRERERERESIELITEFKLLSWKPHFCLKWPSPTKQQHYPLHQIGSFLLQLKSFKQIWCHYLISVSRLLSCCSMWLWSLNRGLNSLQLSSSWTSVRSNFKQPKQKQIVGEMTDTFTVKAKVIKNNRNESVVPKQLTSKRILWGERERDTHQERERFYH